MGSALPASAAADAAAADTSGYVALGDSYSSGEANPPFVDPSCRLSVEAWPYRAGEAAGLATTDLACSGATTADVTKGSDDRPAQVALLASLPAEPEVVTITVGGNDAGFGTVVAACFVGDCVRGGTLPLADAYIATVLPHRLVKTYRAVQAAAPHARLVVVGYPRLVPTSADAVTGCPWLAERERRELNRAADLLSLVTRLSARWVGAEYVDVRGTLRGHELCTQDPWLHPLGDLTEARSWAHPVEKGQQALADAVRPALRR